MVSVIIPTYNRAYCIEKSIRSVLDQTYRDLELIIVDDGSTDNTQEVVESIKDDRIRYIYQENAGACVARNHGINEARGEYIAFHDSDDTWRADKLQKQMAVCDAYDPEIQFCKIAMHTNDGTARIIPKDFASGVCDNPVNLFGIGIATVLAKHSLFDEYSFDPDMPKWQDFELLLRIAKKYPLYCLDEVLYDYYLQDDNISNKTSYHAAKLLLEKHPDFAMKYPIMAEKISSTLIREADKAWSIKHTEAEDCLKLSKEYYNSMYLQIKRALIRLGLYNCLRRVKKIFSRHSSSERKSG